MNNNTIVVAGATGNLGGKIVEALLQLKADVRVLVRADSNPEKLKVLRQKGVAISQVDFTSKQQLYEACLGAGCVVSALSGLHEVIVDTQKLLLDASIQAGVTRFIPSDYSLDFTNLIVGKDRNLDLRREFHTYLDKAPIQATSIFNGAFMDLLTGDMPLILFKLKRILCWGNPDQIMDFTTMDNVAVFTACVALDSHTPRYLRIAGDRKSARSIVEVVFEVTGQKFRLLRAGSIGLLNTVITITKALTPTTKDLYPAWQGMQYMRDMMEGRVKISVYDTNRYPSLRWMSIKEYLIHQNIKQKVNPKK